jgi:antitoxin MazE
MKTHVQRWGNSLGLRIPKSFAEGLRLRDGSPVEISLEEGAVIIKPDLDRSFDLDSLLSKITAENIHPAWEAAGAEAVETGDTEEGRR